MENRKNVIVIGGGFAGVQFIENLDEKLFNVTLLDKINHHQFQPLFYQVATSQLEPSSISFPFRKIFQNKKNVQIRLTEVTAINPETNTVHSTIGDFTYDYLVIAAGCKTNFFGNKVIEENAFTLKSTSDSIELRNHILINFEKIIYASKEEQEALYNIVIVGGGPTGVELAGAFAEIQKHILPKDYPGIDFSRLKIIIIEGSPNTLNSMSDLAHTASRMYLEKLGVEIHTQLVVKDYDGKRAVLSDGKIIPTSNLIWAAGVTSNTFEGLDASVYAHSNRMKVDRTNLVQGYKNVYAVGDIAYMETPKYPKGHPQLANVATNQAKTLAKNLKAIQTKKELKEFEYKDLGSMATIGKNKAVVDLPFIKFKGILAWFTWMFVHLMLILSVKNKLIIFINWAWAYFTKDTSLRLILTQKKKNM
ncbi:NAD(P)/FAD-dependent oxidoreductase [uncultured Cytophaga sp.]|uniref:NAD(P)/FAD-dependent oxidoreductase n=1 Tax=uncultured Cytophaga sp. TaxID=160238 RepID=UPI00261282F5|nr:NAD(P)/FAD-dependent oxidoreductase [uncultured Cytophaga sp.]